MDVTRFTASDAMDDLIYIRSGKEDTEPRSFSGAQAVLIMDSESFGDFHTN